ncbi:nadph oxidase [Anaeramoeba flamelloides]|uniref:Nadph oxidase n=1 Tax=Anaeramoeba flamelloides TaxID=1746091 RepID=A0AAV7ZAF6_9EUKA|nr:nadph oxidase [Anaeramoeba flamelloides]
MFIKKEKNTFILFFVLIVVLGAVEGKWEEVVASGDIPTRRDSSFALFGDKFYVFGGKQGSKVLDDTWIYNMTTASWHEVTAEDHPEARFSMVSDFAEGKFYVSMGEGPGDQFFNDVWVFDMEEETWTKLLANSDAETEVPKKRYGASGGIGSEREYFYITHGFSSEERFDDTWRFSFEKGNWEDISANNNAGLFRFRRPRKRCLHAGNIYREEGSSDDKMFLSGGCGSLEGPCPVTESSIYDTSTKTWAPLTGFAYDFPWDRTPKPTSYTNSVYLDGKIYLVGVQKDILHVYDLSEETWQQSNSKLSNEQAGPLVEKRAAAEIATDGKEYIYIFGGQAGDTFSDIWRIKATELLENMDDLPMRSTSSTVLFFLFSFGIPVAALLFSALMHTHVFSEGFIYKLNFGHLFSLKKQSNPNARGKKSRLNYFVLDFLQFWSPGEFVLVVIFLVIVPVGWFLLRYSASKSERAARGFGYVAMYFYSLAYILPAKNSLVAKFFSTSFERLLYWHRVIGRFSLYSVTIHLILMVVPFISTGNLFRWAAFYNSPILGLVAFLFLFIGVALTYDKVRRKYYEVFFMSHILLIINPVIVFFHNAIFAAFISIPLILYITDKFYRLFASKKGRVLTMDLHKVKDSEKKIVEELIHLRISADDKNAKSRNILPGSFFYLKFHNLSKLQSHPFTCSGAFHDEDSNQMIIDFWIKDIGNYTKQLAKLASRWNESNKKKSKSKNSEKNKDQKEKNKKKEKKKKSKNKSSSSGSQNDSSTNTDTDIDMGEQDETHKHLDTEDIESNSGEDSLKMLKVTLQGPYGKPRMDYSKFKHNILISGGIGITPSISFVNHFLRENPESLNPQNQKQKQKQKQKKNIKRTKSTGSASSSSSSSSSSIKSNSSLDSTKKTSLMDDSDPWKFLVIHSSRTVKQYQAFSPFFTNVSNSNQIKSILHVTRNITEKTELLLKDSQVTLQLNPKRPNLEQILLEIQEKSDPGEKIAVYVCGPRPLILSLTNIINKLNKKNPIFYYHHETFLF